MKFSALRIARVTGIAGVTLVGLAVAVAPSAEASPAPTTAGVTTTAGATTTTTGPAPHASIRAREVAPGQVVLEATCDRDTTTATVTSSGLAAPVTLTFVGGRGAFARDVTRPVAQPGTYPVTLRCAGTTVVSRLVVTGRRRAKPVQPQVTAIPVGAAQTGGGALARAGILG